MAANPFTFSIGAVTSSSITASTIGGPLTDPWIFEIYAGSSISGSPLQTQSTGPEDQTYTFHGLSPNTTYTVRAYSVENLDYDAHDTTTTSAGDTPKTATQGQWENLADRIQSKAEIGTTVSTPSNVVFVQTANIADGAVTASKLAISGIIDVFYPVGSYYETSDTSFNPNTAWGGTWVEDSAGRVTVAMDTGTFTTVGDTGGEETHTLTVAEMPSHHHRLNRGQYGNTYMEYIAYSSGVSAAWRDAAMEDTGGGLAHNNLQPYVVIKRWHRTA